MRNVSGDVLYRVPGVSQLIQCGNTCSITLFYIKSSCRFSVATAVKSLSAISLHLPLSLSLFLDCPTKHLASAQQTADDGLANPESKAAEKCHGNHHSRTQRSCCFRDETLLSLIVMLSSNELHEICKYFICIHHSHCRREDL